MISVSNSSDQECSEGDVDRLRERGFTDDEAAALLSAAFHLKPGGERPKTFAAKRWAPWLCAYAAARSG